MTEHDSSRFSVLIIDDEVPAVESIRDSVDWRAIGFDGVECAYSAKQAKLILERRRVDLMICDIEMPRESGLELLAWVRERYPDIECVFLTCHSEFTYAKEAVRLGGFDYILKPVPYDELRKTAERALLKIKQSRGIDKEAALWRENTRVLVESFWKDAISVSISTGQESFASVARERGVLSVLPDRLVPILITIRHWKREFSERDKTLLTWAVVKAASEFFFRNTTPVIVKRTHTEMVLLPSFGASDFSFREACDRFVLFCADRLYCEIACYFGNPVPPAQVPDSVDRLSSLDRKNIEPNFVAIGIGDGDMLLGRKRTREIPDMRSWPHVIKRGNCEALANEISAYLTGGSAGTAIDAEFLVGFHHDFMQTVYSALMSRGIHARELFAEEATDEAAKKATRSIADMVAWVRYVLERASGAINLQIEEGSPIGRAKTYIARNLSRDITREEIAATVGLNADYLTRIFKKETNLSLMDWLVVERLEYARELLLRTEMPVGEIAAQVGYANFSHFSAIFKKRFGMNPSEFKKNVLG